MNSTHTTANFIKICYALNSPDELIVAFPSKKNLCVHYVALAISIAIFFPSVLLNAVTVLTIFKSRVLRKKVYNFIVLVKSVLDFAIALIFIPLYINFLASEIRGNPSCVTFLASKKMGVLAYIYSVTALSTMNFERYLAIFHPFTHRAKVTKASLLTYTLVACGFQTILFAFALINIDIIPVLLTVITSLFIGSTVVVYIGIIFFRCGKRSHQVNQAFTQSQREVEKKKRKLMEDLELAKSCFLVVVSCLVCLLPGMVSNMERLNVKGSFSAVVQRRFFALLFLLKTMLNSVIFFWKNKTSRMVAMDMIKSIFSRY